MVNNRKKSNWLNEEIVTQTLNLRIEVNHLNLFCWYHIQNNVNKIHLKDLSFREPFSKRANGQDICINTIFSEKRLWNQILAFVGPYLPQTCRTSFQFRVTCGYTTTILYLDWLIHILRSEIFIPYSLFSSFRGWGRLLWGLWNLNELHPGRYSWWS